MVMSMTGYGINIMYIANTTISVEIRSINHKYLDFTPKIPRSLLFLEDKIKKIVQSYFQRGRIEVYIGLVGDSFVKKSLKMDWDLMDKYMDQIKKAKIRYNLPGDIPTTMITALPELITVHETEQQSDNLKDAIILSTKRACEQVIITRKQEGTFLLEDIKERMQAIQNMVVLIKGRRINVIEEYRKRIKKRIEDFIEGAITMDQNQLHQEIAFLAEKGDITEEITRLLSHIDYFFTTIDKEEAIGRKLDFITQEMHRETNTIGAKSMDTKISEWIVSLKSDIEKVKEQIQNIE